ncbi:hypothetical protein [Streptomyces sp. NPDC051098]|uniref:hypothetical protein n=1 Tax=Streptomyces sp. NPDC051098 TaxID=3155411 RepID=UPI0034319485
MSGDAIFFGLIHDFAVVRAAFLVTIGLKVYKRSGPALEHAHFVPSAMAGEREHEAPEAFRRRLNARALAQQAAGIRVARRDCHPCEG